MGGTGVVDRFLAVFSQYIDSGFGLLSGEVAFIATTLIVIDVTLAALFWSWGANEDIIARLVKKTLFVGIFAYIIGNWGALANIVFESFAGLGLKASGAGLGAADLLRPGRVAQVGIDAAWPLLEAIADLVGYVGFFENFLQIVILLLAWAVVVIAFFILSIQLFVTLIEFKLTTLAGFVLIPFGLFGKTAFLAERVLGNVVSSGIKVLVLAVIIGIGSTLFAEFRDAIPGEPTIEDALAIMLASLTLLGLGIFGPGIANGIVAGGPQLGAGAAAGTLLNGNRLPYDAAFAGIDISAIPLAAVERIEVLPDGASALYGSDAVAGVINVILRRDFEGVATSAQIGASTDGGNFRQQVDVVAGTTWSGGGVMLAYDFTNNSAVDAGQRPFSSPLIPETTLFPASQRHAATLTAYQEITPDIEVGLEALYAL
jgi:P-type conjugative transfer protein TrbL